MSMALVTNALGITLSTDLPRSSLARERRHSSLVAKAGTSVHGFVGSTSMIIHLASRLQKASRAKMESGRANSSLALRFASTAKLTKAPSLGVRNLCLHPPVPPSHQHPRHQSPHHHRP